MGRLFGTNGVRGLVGDTMTPDLAMKLGKAVGTWLSPGDNIALGSDARASRDMLAAAFASGIQSTGVHVTFVGVVPSPGIQLYVRDKGFAAGAIITASHNPPEWNGIKLIAPDGTETSADEEAAVEDIFFAESFRTAGWKDVGVAQMDDGCASYYLDAVLAQVDVEAIRAKRFKVVLDPGGGAGCVTAPRLMEALGVDVVPLSCELDGAFSDRPSEPSPQNSQACIDAVKAHGADLGVLQDGDADRAVFIDETGGYIWGDQSLSLAALHELQRYPEDQRIMCTAVSSSSCVQDAVKMVGGTLEWTVVGSPVVARDMLRLGASFGGEDNGGLMFTRHQVCRDGLMAMAFMLELMAKTGRTFSELVSDIPRYALVKDKIAVPDDQKQALLTRYKEAAAKEADIQNVDDRDGVKAYLAEGWVLVRPSGTEPIFRVQGEAKDEATAAALVGRFKALLESQLQVA
ncbi:MAG: phosphoglucosamine mutase [Thermoplasmatota archaeon]